MAKTTRMSDARVMHLAVLVFCAVVLVYYASTDFPSQRRDFKRFYSLAQAVVYASLLDQLQFEGPNASDWA
jgi:hypothetical protein